MKPSESEKVVALVNSLLHEHWETGYSHGLEKGKQSAIDTTASLVGQKLDAAYQRGVAAGRQENSDSYLAKQRANEAYQLGLQRGREESGWMKVPGGPVVSEETAPLVPIKDSERIDELFAQLESVKESLECAHARGDSIAALDRIQREHGKALMELRGRIESLEHLYGKLGAEVLPATSMSLRARVSALEGMGNGMRRER